ncbi:MAG: dephospho-CoA kinase [Deltaproteobacteria bacterium]|nr:dephospho-CoA kinase [Deltaproteobacteria bacterium]
MKAGPVVRPRLFGLTGGIGSGKSAVAEMLRARGVPVFDADEAARVLTLPGGKAVAAVAAAFGPPVALPGGSLDRPALARLVFSEPEARRKLERIVHPLVDAEARAWMAARAAEGHALCFLAAPLLLETGREAQVAAVVAVVADVERRVSRVVARDRTTPEAVRARIAAQMGDAERLRRADFVLRNDGTTDELRAQVDELLRKVGVEPPPSGRGVT